MEVVVVGVGWVFVEVGLAVDVEMVEMVESSLGSSLFFLLNSSSV